MIAEVDPSQLESDRVYVVKSDCLTVMRYVVMGDPYAEGADHVMLT